MLLLAGGGADAQNLLDNSRFDTQIEPWQGGFFQVSSWSSEDADACPESGSFAGQSVDFGDSTVAVIGSPENCVEVFEGDHLFQEVSYKSTAPEIGLRLFAYDNATCDGSTRGTGAPVQLPASATWTSGEREIIIGKLEGPTSMSFVARAEDLSAAPFTVWFDNLYLGKVDRIFADDFEGGTHCRWSDHQPHT